MMAANIRMQPISSLWVKDSPRKMKPPRAPKRASVLNIMDATVGLASFCPRAWNVNARPQDNTPAKKRLGNCPTKISAEMGSLKMATARLRVPAIRNCMHESFATSTFGAKCPIHRI